jgi:hypothetical protein
MIEFVDADQSLTAEGHVTVVQGTSTLKADFLRYERTAKRLLAKGHVNLTEDGATLLGDSMEYDLVAEKGTVTSALGYKSPWMFTGDSWEKELDHLVGSQIAFTSCELEQPHYRIRSHRVHLVPNQHFWAWNNVAYADRLPVFYSPFLYRNLAKRRVVMHFQPGHDDPNGDFVKTITTVRFTDLVYDRVYYDHYSRQGNGIGNEFNYSHPGRWEGSLFGYYIDPHGNPELAGAPDTPQYNIRSYHWQRLDDYRTIQSNINLRKNISFNNRYFPQDINQSVNDITSSVALTQQKGHANQRIVVERLDAPDPGDNSLFAETHVQTASYPRYDFTYYQVPLWSPDVSTGSVRPSALGPLLFNANATVGNTYRRLDDRQHLNGAGSFTLSEAMRLSSKWSLTPTFTPQLTWQDKFDPQTAPPVNTTATVVNTGLFRGFQGRLGTADTLRYRPFSSLTIDQTYSLTARLEPNGTSLDEFRSDHGIETHRVGWLAFWRPSRQVLMRSFSGYDLRQLRDEDPSLYRQRKWEAWVNELTWSPTYRTDYFFRYALAHYPMRSQFWEASYRFYGPYRTRVETGLLYNRGLPGQLTWNNGLGIWLSPGWRVDATVHALVPNASLNQAFKRGSLIDEEFKVIRDLHCWQAEFVYRNIPPLSRSYSLMLTLKLGVKTEEEITNADLESKFYPWRARP